MMKKMMILGLMATAGIQTVFANNDIVIYQNNTPSSFPTEVRKLVNRAYAKADCNDHATYVLGSEKVSYSEDGTSTRYSGLLRVYNEVDQYMVKSLGKVDQKGVPYRERSFLVVKRGNKIFMSSMSCESGSYADAVLGGN